MPNAALQNPADQATPDNPVIKSEDPSIPPPDKKWDPEIQAGLLELTKIAAREYEGPWKAHFRQNLEAEEFWKGNHYPVADDKDFSWRTPFEFALEQNRLEDMPVYQYVINIYQAFGLSAITILAQRLPKVRWFPELANREEDVATAKAASRVSAYIEDKNKLKLKAVREAYLCWTQGLFGTWTRYVREFKYGHKEEPIIEASTVEVAPERYICPPCGAETPIAAEDVGIEPSMDGGGAGTLDAGPAGPDFSGDNAGELQSCPECGYQFTGANRVPAEYTEIPVINGYRKTPKGMVKLSTYGAINLCVDPYVDEQEDSGYVILSEEVQAGAVRATWQHIIDNMESTPNEGQYTADASTDQYAKNERMRLADAPAPFGRERSYAAMAKGYMTVKRCWFRPWYLYNHLQKTIRDKMIAAFPDGVYVAFANGIFLEAENANMDKEWDLCYPMPGKGLYRQSLGASTIPLNKQIDDGANIVAEHLDFGSSPPMFFDAQHVNAVALQNSPMRPAMYVPVVRQNGGTTKALSELFHQPQFRVDPNIYGYGKSLIEVGQIVSGVMPSLFGGPLKGNDTLGAYQQSSNQAVGKMLLFWTAVKQHHATMMTQAVESFQRYQEDDIVLNVVGESGEVIADYVHLDELNGSCYAKPESDEDFPATMAEIRMNLLGLLQQAPEFAQQIFMNPTNMPVLKKFLANDEVEFASENQRSKTYREIEQLLTMEPIMAMDPLTGMPAVDPMTGQPQFQPSIPVDVWIDDHAVAIATIQEWGRKRGIEVQRINPAGYANVMAKLLAHYDAAAVVAQKQAMLQVAAQAPLMAAAAGQEEQKTGGNAPPPG